MGLLGNQPGRLMIDITFAFPLLVAVLMGTRLPLLRALGASRRDVSPAVLVLLVAVATACVSIRDSIRGHHISPYQWVGQALLIVLLLRRSWDTILRRAVDNWDPRRPREGPAGVGDDQAPSSGDEVR